MDHLQGLADHALNVVKAMRADGLEASTVVLNSLINAFGEDRRVVEAFSVLQFMKENVSDVLPLFLYLDLHHSFSVISPSAQFIWIS